MLQIIFSTHDARCSSGYRFIGKEFDTEELAVDYMHKYHNRCTGWYTIIEDGRATRKYDKVGVIL